MRTARLAALTVALVLVGAACAGSPAATPSAPASVPPEASAAPSPATPATNGSAVSITDFAFQPAAITVAVGTTVTWTNNDSASHTITADDGSFTSDTLATGATFSHTFDTAGTVTYHCSIHPSMTGTVTVQ